MENSIKRFTKELNNGLYLIDMPTGVGKTYKAIEYIFNHFDEDRKFFYITSLNKNVDSAFYDLKKMFHKAGRDEEFLNGCIRLYSNAEKVIEVLVTIEVPNDALSRLDSFKTLKNEIEMYHSIKNSTFNESAAILERISKDIKEKYEPAFRHEVETYLNEQKSVTTNFNHPYIFGFKTTLKSIKC